MIIVQIQRFLCSFILHHFIRPWCALVSNSYSFKDNLDNKKDNQLAKLKLNLLNV